MSHYFSLKANFFGLFSDVVYPGGSQTWVAGIEFLLQTTCPPWFSYFPQFVYYKLWQKLDEQVSLIKYFEESKIPTLQNCAE